MIDVKKITEQTPLYDSTLEFLQEKRIAWGIGVQTGMCMEFISNAYLLNAAANGGTIEPLVVPFEAWKELYAGIMPEDEFFTGLLKLKELEIIEFESFLKRDGTELVKFLWFKIPSLHSIVTYKETEKTPHDLYWLLKAAITEEEIERLKSMRYVDFLKTEYWSVVRNYVLFERESNCFLCPSTSNLHVHHKTYEHRGCEIHHLNDLVVLCNKCHARHHGKLG